VVGLFHPLLCGLQSVIWQASFGRQVIICFLFSLLPASTRPVSTPGCTGLGVGAGGGGAGRERHARSGHDRLWTARPHRTLTPRASHPQPPSGPSLCSTPEGRSLSIPCSSRRGGTEPKLAWLPGACARALAWIQLLIKNKVTGQHSWRI
jgi:hypothetical protein